MSFVMLGGGGAQGTMCYMR